MPRWCAWRMPIPGYAAELGARHPAVQDERPGQHLGDADADGVVLGPHPAAARILGRRLR